MRLALSEYMDHFSWSQAEMAREADVSTGVIDRALKGETISRRNAKKIVTAIDRNLKLQGVRDRVTIASFNGLNVSPIRRSSRKVQAKEEVEQ